MRDRGEFFRARRVYVYRIPTQISRSEQGTESAYHTRFARDNLYNVRWFTVKRDEYKTNASTRGVLPDKKGCTRSLYWPRRSAPPLSLREQQRRRALISARESNIACSKSSYRTLYNYNLKCYYELNIIFLKIYHIYFYQKE